MSTKAKFLVQSKTETKDGFKILMTAVTGDSEENKSFFKYTPSGTIEMGLVEKETAEIFVPGKECFVLFAAVE